MLPFNNMSTSKETTPAMLYSATIQTMTTEAPLRITRSLSESCLEGMPKGDSEPCRSSLERPFAETLLKAPTDSTCNLHRCVSLPQFVASEMMVQDSVVLEKEHTKKSCPYSTSTTFVFQQTKNTAKSILDEGSDDAITASSSFSFIDSSSQGPSSVDTDFENSTSSDHDDYNFYVETEGAQEEEYEHEHEQYDSLMEHTRYPQDFTAVSAPAPSLSVTIQLQPQKQQKSIQSLIDNEDWMGLKTLVERDPNVCRQRVNMIFQNENITCLPLHAVLGRRGAAILSIVDCLVTTYPGALMRKDEGGDRLPLHMAILKGASIAVIRYILEALPQALEKPDCEGNLPLHYAAMYSSEDVIRLTAGRYSAACRHANLKERMPLHLLCARNWDHQDYDLISLDQIHCIFTSFPAAVRHADRNGCLPLHVACSQPQPRWDVLNLLIEAFSVGLLHKDDEDRVPLQICRRIASSALATSSPTSTATLTTAFCRDNDVVLAYLRDKTNQVKRKQLRDRIFTIRFKRA
jgi:hypothetical protein